MFVVGKVLKPQGIKGEIKVEIITSFPEHLEETDVLYLDDEQQTALTIDDVRLAGNFAFIKFAGINSRDEAEKLRDKYLSVKEDALYPLEDDEYYHHQLIGLDVFSEQGTLIGRLEDVESYPANDVFVLKDQKGRQHLIPAVKEFIVNVDLKAGKMTIRQLEGLLD